MLQSFSSFPSSVLKDWIGFLFIILPRHEDKCPSCSSHVTGLKNVSFFNPWHGAISWRYRHHMCQISITN
ncbi:hypothetical protein Mapa_016727 [Marchantia paleacea]|nr:hypothetical protein Mapa_016727 [Marchantia paleacea]